MKISVHNNKATLIISALLAATALTSPLTLATPSMSAETQIQTASALANKHLEILGKEASKNESLKFHELKITEYGSDDTLQRSSAFNLGHLQNAIYNVMYTLGQTGHFNSFQRDALHENPENNDFLMKVITKIKDDFDFANQIILNGNENLKSLDVAQRVFLFLSTTQYGIVSEAYRLALREMKKNLDNTYEQEKAILEGELNNEKALTQEKIDRLDNDHNKEEISLNQQIEKNKIYISDNPQMTPANRKSTNELISTLEQQKRTNKIKKDGDVLAERAALTKREREIDKKLQDMKNRNDKKYDDYKKKLAFIFEEKGASYIPLKKTATRWWSGQGSNRSDYEFYNEFDLLLHENPDIMPTARAEFFHQLFKDFKDTSPNAFKISALKSLLGFQQDDADLISVLYNSNQSAPQRDPEALPASNSLTAQEVKTTNAVAAAVVDSKKKNEGQTVIETVEEEITLSFTPKMKAAITPAPAAHIIITEDSLKKESSQSSPQKKGAKTNTVNQGAQKKNEAGPKTEPIKKYGRNQRR